MLDSFYSIIEFVLSTLIYVSIGLLFSLSYVYNLENTYPK